MPAKRHFFWGLLVIGALAIAGVLAGSAVGLAQDSTPTATLYVDATVEAGVEAALTATAFARNPPTPTRMPLGEAAEDDAFLGPADAPVTIVEFSDFQCGFCGRWYQQTLPLILEKYPNEVKFVYRDFTIFGDDSVRAAMATECAEEQGAFWEMHNAIFDALGSEQRPPLTQETLVGFAGDLGLDTPSFEGCLASEKYIDEVGADYQAAVSYGFGGTPGFVINGQIYAFGAQPFETFDAIIQEELANPSSAEPQAQVVPTATLTPAPTTAAEATTSAQVAAALTATAVNQPTPYIPPTPTRMPPAQAADDDAFLGPADAPVTIVEFSDFQCGFCGRWYQQTLPQILEKYPDQVKFVYRDFPIFGDNSVRAAMATECAEEQGAFWEMHNVLFDRIAAGDAALDADGITGYAGELGLDTTAFAECMVSERYLNEVARDYQAAQAYGFGGTPGFVINGQIYAFGAQPFETFDDIIQAELASYDPDAAPVAVDTAPTDPSADNWVLVAPGLYNYSADAQTTAELYYEVITPDVFATKAGVSEGTHADMLGQMRAAYESELGELGLATTAETFDGPTTSDRSGYATTSLRVMIAPQLVPSGDLFPGVDLVLVLVARPDEQLAVVQVRTQGGVNERVYADFQAWLDVNMSLLAES